MRIFSIFRIPREMKRRRRILSARKPVKNRRVVYSPWGVFETGALFLFIVG